MLHDAKFFLTLFRTFIEFTESILAGGIMQSDTGGYNLWILPAGMMIIDEGATE